MNKFVRWIIIFFGTCIAVLAAAIELSAQSVEGFLYGTVRTENNTYTGPIRWGKEEILWADLFNAAKTSNQYMKLVPEQKDSDSWLDFDWSFKSIWEDKLIAHQFVCRFGDLAQITFIGDGKAKIRLKNNAELTVDGEGYNDLRSSIEVIDEELGLVSLNWDRVKSVEFRPTPTRLKTIFGMPLYGTVESVRKETFTGLVLWDNDEHVGADKLDGNSSDGKLSVRFDEIKGIEKKDHGSLVSLNTGRQVFLTGSNDVNAENRGIVVLSEELGIVKLSWQAFKKVVFTPAPHSGPTYDDFTKPSILSGTVSLLEGDDLTGRIVYDIDEAVDVELLEGKENDIEYQIPFRLIRKIVPKNYDYSSIELISGKTMLLGGLRDVSSKNSGLLVFRKGQKEPDYVPWKKIYEIVLN